MSVFGILITIYLAFFIALSKMRPVWAMMLILASLPSYLVRFQIFGIPFTLLESMILTLFVVWFMGNHKTVINNIKLRLENKNKALSENQKLHRYPFDIEIILLLVISFISVGVSGFSNEALGIWKAYFFEPLLFFILIFNILGRERFNSKIIQPLLVSAFLISVFAIYQKFTGIFIANPMWAAEGSRRVTSIFDYPNALGLFLAPLILLFIGFLFSSIFDKDQNSSIKTIFKRLASVRTLFITLTIILSALAVYFARSEGALIGVLAGLVVFGFLAGKKMRLTVLVLIVVGSGVIFGHPVLKTKAIDKITFKDFSLEIRKQQWRETCEMLASSPSKFIFGSGLASYKQEILPYHQEGIFFNKNQDPDFRRKIVIFDDKYRGEHWFPVEIYLYPHNILLNFWTELGFLGMILFVWIIIKFFYTTLKSLKYNNKYLSLGLIGSMTAIVIHGIVDVPYFKNDLAVMFWVIVAMIAIASLDKVEHENNI